MLHVSLQNLGTLLMKDHPDNAVLLYLPDWMCNDVTMDLLQSVEQADFSNATIVLVGRTAINELQGGATAILEHDIYLLLV